MKDLRRKKCVINKRSVDWKMKVVMVTFVMELVRLFLHIEKH
jgi:hypothetical protein